MKRVVPVALIAVLAHLTPASATATLVCDVEDKSISFSIQAALGGPRRGTVANFTGKLDVKLRTVPADLRSLELVRDDLQQSWLDGKQLRLEFYRERTEAPGAFVLLVIDTRKISENRYRGRYTLETDVAGPGNAFGSTPRRVQGNASCSVD